MTDLLLQYDIDYELETIRDQTQVQWCKQQYNKERDRLVKLLTEYHADIEGFPEYMKILIEMANIKSYPSLRLDIDTAKDFHKYHSLVYRIYDEHHYKLMEKYNV